MSGQASPSELTRRGVGCGELCALSYANRLVITEIRQVCAHIRKDACTNPGDNGPNIDCTRRFRMGMERLLANVGDLSSLARMTPTELPGSGIELQKAL